MKDRRKQPPSYFTGPDEFYDSIAEKYDHGNFWIENKERSRKARAVCQEYIKIVEIISEKTGFNTSAPERFYVQAKELSKKLESKIKETRQPTANEEFLHQANWALFEKFDFVEAKKLLKRMVF